MNWLKELIDALMFILTNKNDSMPENIPPIAPQAPQDNLTNQVAPKYLWDTPQDVKHSIRVICDEEGLNIEQKNTLDATIHGESDYNTHAHNYNYAFSRLTGRKYIASTDFGLCQWNDYYHGKEISPMDAEFNPEKAVRLMCTYWKLGRRNQWVAYSSGHYLRYYLE